jgi:hypothetical protein
LGFHSGTAVPTLGGVPVPLTVVEVVVQGKTGTVEVVLVLVPVVPVWVAVSVAGPVADPVADSVADTVVGPTPGPVAVVVAISLTADVPGITTPVVSPPGPPLPVVTGTTVAVAVAVIVTVTVSVSVARSGQPHVGTPNENVVSGTNVVQIDSASEVEVVSLVE